MASDAVQYCNNCENEAVCHYETDGGVYFNLCFTCSEAFGLGQVNPDKSVERLDDAYEEVEQ